MQLRRAAGFIAFLFAVLSCAEANAGVFVLYGDSTPAFSLTNMPPNGAVAGNDAIFSNVFGAGSHVVVLSLAFNGAPAEINEFYNTLRGKTSMIVNRPLTGSQLTGIDLLLIAVLAATSRLRN